MTTTNDYNQSLPTNINIITPFAVTTQLSALSQQVLCGARSPLINSFAAGGNYSRPHSLAAVGDYRRRIYAIYVGGT